MTRLFSTICVLLALALVASTNAQERETPPPGSTPKNFNLPEKSTFRMDNGMQATLVPFGSVPKATISVIVRSGNLNEGEQTWLADLSADFSQAAASMGGSIDVSVGEDQTTLSAQVLSEFAPDMLALLADVIIHPAFPEAELERLRRDRLRMRSVASTRPQQMATAAFREALYGDHPYGNLLPGEEQLTSYTIDDVRGYYENNFGAQRTHIFVAGVFDDPAIRDAIEASFAEWHTGPAPLIDVPEPASGKVVVDIIDRPDASQSNVLLGLPAVAPGHSDWVALQITNSLLGGMFSSRITSNIREDKGYTYSPFSSLSSRYSDAYWVQSAAVTTDVTAAALKEILYEIDELQENPPGDEELTGVKNYVSGVFVLQNSTPSGIINILNVLDLHGLPDNYLTDYVSNVHALTPNDISETAQKYLRQDDMTLVVVGDRARISESVAPYLEKAEE
jgi:predicted Zn-dependent peptidase